MYAPRDLGAFEVSFFDELDVTSVAVANVLRSISAHTGRLICAEVASRLTTLPNIVRDAIAETADRNRVALLMSCENDTMIRKVSPLDILYFLKARDLCLALTKFVREATWINT